MRAVAGLVFGLPLLVMACSGPEPEQPEPCEPSVCMDATLDGATCVLTPVAAGAVCDDGELATRDDACDGGGSCAGVPYDCEPGPCEDASTPNGVDCDVVFSESGAVCDDGDVATRDDACDGGGACLGTPSGRRCRVSDTSASPRGPVRCRDSDLSDVILWHRGSV